MFIANLQSFYERFCQNAPAYFLILRIFSFASTSLRATKRVPPATKPADQEKLANWGIFFYPGWIGYN